MAYYAAREAISSWGTEFGYQLIDEDWTLTFPPRDPLLAEAETRAVEESRRRLAWLAEVRPVKAAKPTRRGLAFVLSRKEGAVLLRKRPAKGLLGGMDEVPSTPWRERARPATCRSRVLSCDSRRSVLPSQTITL